MIAQTEITFHLTVARPRDNAVDFRAVVSLPYLPRTEDMITVFHGDDFRKVDQVYYSQASGFEIYLEDDDNESMPKSQFTKLGWKEDK